MPSTALTGRRGTAARCGPAARTAGGRSQSTARACTRRPAGGGGEQRAGDAVSVPAVKARQRQSQRQCPGLHNLCKYAAQWAAAHLHAHGTVHADHAQPAAGGTDGLRCRPRCLVLCGALLSGSRRGGNRGREHGAAAAGAQAGARKAVEAGRHTAAARGSCGIGGGGGWRGVAQQQVHQGAHLLVQAALRLGVWRGKEGLGRGRGRGGGEKGQQPLWGRGRRGSAPQQASVRSQPVPPSARSPAQLAPLPLKTTPQAHLPAAPARAAAPRCAPGAATGSPLPPPPPPQRLQATGRRR